MNFFKLIQVYIKHKLFYTPNKSQIVNENRLAVKEEKKKLIKKSRLGEILSIFRFLYFFPLFWRRFKKAQVLFDIHMFLYLKAEWLFNYYWYIMFDYFYEYIDRWYEDDTDYLYNKPQWEADKGRIIFKLQRGARNYLYFMFTKPITFFKTRGFVSSFKYNWKFLKYAGRELYAESKWIAGNVFWSLYYNDPLVFREKFPQEKKNLDKKVEIVKETKQSPEVKIWKEVIKKSSVGKLQSNITKKEDSKKP